MNPSPPSRKAGSPSVIVTTTLAAGVAVLLAGTFFPWLASGEAQRNVYGAAGVVQRIAELGQPIGYVLDAVPLLGLFLVLCGVLWAVGRRAIAGLAVAVVTVLVCVIAGAALDHRSSGTVRIVALGPMITLAGGGITAMSFVLLLVLGRRATAKPRAGITRNISTSTPSSTSMSTSTDSVESGPPARSSRMELT